MLILLFSIFSYLLGMGSIIALLWMLEFSLNENSAALNWQAFFLNLGLFAVFPLQHSLLARESARNWIQSHLHPLMERPLFVATSGLAMFTVIFGWSSFGPALYDVSPAWPFNIVYYIVVVLIALTSRELNHGCMFGLRHGFAAVRKEDLPPQGLKTTGIFGVVRHPLTTLFVVALWTHEMLTASRLEFNILFTLYAVGGTFLEERDLKKKYPGAYEDYARKVPAYVPFLRAIKIPNRRSTNPAAKNPHIG